MACPDKTSKLTRPKIHRHQKVIPNRESLLLMNEAPRINIRICTLKKRKSMDLRRMKIKIRPYNLSWTKLSIFVNYPRISGRKANLKTL